MTTAAAPIESHSARRRRERRGLRRRLRPGPLLSRSRSARSSDGVLISKFAISLQTFRDDALQLRRRLDAQPDGLRGPRPLDHFVENQAEAPDVGAVIHGLAAGLLRRHVGGCSHHDTLPRAGNRGHVRLRCGRPALGEAEIEHFHAIARGDEDVGGFDVAVDDARAMRGVQRVGNLDAHVEQRVQAQRTRGEPILQRRPLQILHHDERSPVLLADVVDRADVWMVERRCGPGFALKAAQRLGITRQIFGDELERHGTAEAANLRLCTRRPSRRRRAFRRCGSARASDRSADRRRSRCRRRLRAPASSRAARSIAGAPRNLSARSCAASSERTSSSSSASPPHALRTKASRSAAGRSSADCSSLSTRVQRSRSIRASFIPCAPGIFHGNLAYSARAALTTGTSWSAFFHSVKRSL